MDQDPKEWTVEFVEALGRRGTNVPLWVWCQRCRLSVMLDPTALVLAGYGKRKLSSLKFRCSRCQEIGQHRVSWHVEGESCSYEVGSGELKGRLPAMPR